MKNVLKLYDEEVRLSPVSTAEYSVNKDADVTYLLYNDGLNYISFWSFPDNECSQSVRRQLERCKEQRQTIMWRVYGHDQPSSLRHHLAENGFTLASKGTLMCASLQQLEVPACSFCICKVVDEQGLLDYLSVANEVFEDSNDDHYENYLGALNDEKTALYCAYIDNKPIGCGRIQLSSNNTFALLYGGSVHKDYRSRGVYRALVRQRMQFAKAANATYMCTEAWSTSKPVLKKMGFDELDTEQTWIFDYA